MTTCGGSGGFKQGYPQAPCFSTHSYPQAWITMCVTLHPLSSHESLSWQRYPHGTVEKLGTTRKLKMHTYTQLVQIVIHICGYLCGYAAVVPCKHRDWSYPQLWNYMCVTRDPHWITFHRGYPLAVHNIQYTLWISAVGLAPANLMRCEGGSQSLSYTAVSY